MKVVCLEVIHKDCKTAHNFCLLFDSLNSLTPSSDVHLGTDPIYLLEVEFDVTPVSARAMTERLVTYLRLSLALLDSDHALRILVQVQVPRAINLFKSPFF